MSVKRFLIALGIIALGFLTDQGGRPEMVCRLGVCTPAPTPVSVAFTPLHTYFMSPTGSDAAAGTSTSTAWATPDHAGLVCGDVIIAATGAYTAGQFGMTHSPGTCPSTTGGIDGAGGIYFVTVLCAGTLGTCTISGTQGGLVSLVQIQANNWSIQGFQCNGGGTLSCFESLTPDGVTCAGTPTIYHHHAYINNIAYNASQAFDGDDCGGAHTLTYGIDYWAVIGNIAENASQIGICAAAIDAIAVANFDTVSGTHIYIYGNFAWNNNFTCNSDSEAYLFDSWDAHGFQNTGVLANNIGFTSARYGWALFYQAFQGTSYAFVPTIKVYNNTFYNDNLNNGTDCCDGEIDVDSNVNANTNTPWPLTVINNIAQSVPANSNALTVGGVTWNNSNFSGNILASSNGTSQATNVALFHGNTVGSNTYTSPSFTNVSDLITNRNGTPNCSGFTNVTACMGWDAIAQTLTTPSTISDLVPTAGGTAGKGYQNPTTACAANADYPTWLKGVVYLKASGFVNGAAITENAGLVTKPCGM